MDGEADDMDFNKKKKFKVDKIGKLLKVPIRLPSGWQLFLLIWRRQLLIYRLTLLFRYLAILQFLLEVFLQKLHIGTLPNLI